MVTERKRKCHAESEPTSVNKLFKKCRQRGPVNFIRDPDPPVGIATGTIRQVLRVVVQVGA